MATGKVKFFNTHIDRYATLISRDGRPSRSTRVPLVTSTARGRSFHINRRGGHPRGARPHLKRSGASLRTVWPVLS
jgi:hypothetical protein